MVVRVNGEVGGLEADFLQVERPTPENSGDLQSETPLRAFAAKVVELIEAHAQDAPGGARMRRMLVEEKASEDLNRIERWAREAADGAS